MAQTIFFAGSIKWIGGVFDAHDLGALIGGAAQVPGFESGRSGLVVVSLGGVASDVTGTADVVWGPSDVLAAWD